MRRVQLTPLIAAACAGVAAWTSIGSLAVTDAGTLARVGLLPPFWLLPVLMLGFAAIARAARLSTPTALPLFFSLILLLPWIPGPVPAAFLLWAGHIAAAVWLTVLVCAWIAKSDRRGIRPPFAPRIAATVAFVLYLAAGWWLAGILPGGDEPHYLVISQSLLRDRDLQIENNHDRGDYREYFGGALRPHFLKRGANGQIYSIHAPGLPAVVAPAYALFGYRGVVVFLSMAAALGSALLWRASYVLTGSLSAAWFGWAAGALTVPFFFEAFAVYPDGLCATLVLFAAWPLLEEKVSRARWVAVGAALGVLPWLHTRFAIISAALGLALLLRLKATADGRFRIASFLLVAGASALAWFGFFRIVYGTFDPTVPYGGDTQSRPINILHGLPALLFDQQFGILPNAPVYGFCLVGMIALARRRPRLALELSAVAITYLLATSAFYMWWGGSSAPGRFFVPVLPLLALPGAWLWKSTPHWSTRAVGTAALMLSLATTAVLVAVDGGQLAYNVRDGYARAAEWLSPVVDVSRGLPSFFRQTAGDAVLRAGIWVLALLAASVGLRMLERRGTERATLTLATPACLAVAIMCALTAVWALDRVPAATPETSQLSLLGDYDTGIRPRGIRMGPLRFEAAERVLSTITIATPGRLASSSGPTLLLVPRIVPGGRYEIRWADLVPSSGSASLVIGPMARAIETWDLATDFRDGSAELDLPVSVGSLVIAGDQEAERRGLVLHPKRVWEGRSRLTRDYARRAERYGSIVAFFFDDDAFVEEPGIWVRGGSATQLVASPVDRNIPFQLLVRNAPVTNRVSIEIDGHAQTLQLQPREERLVPIQFAQNRPAVLIRIRTETGFRPSEVEPGSTDTRFLGVWIEFR